MPSGYGALGERSQIADLQDDRRPPVDLDTGGTLQDK